MKNHFHKKDPTKANQKRFTDFKESSTSWQNVSKWYNSCVGESGHYYHKNIIIPGIKRLLNFDQLDRNQDNSLLDLACGQGVLSQNLPNFIDYQGIDLSKDLIAFAKKNYSNSLKQKKALASSKPLFEVSDITKPLSITKYDFSMATIILALQNIEDPFKVFQNAYKHLNKNGKLLIVMNHPCFRIPRQSSWQVDEMNKVQFRRIDRYKSPMKIPIQAHPSQGEHSVKTWSFHYPLANYTQWLFEAGFYIEIMEEWCSDKISTGKMAKIENRSREEFPLFLAIRAIKIK